MFASKQELADLEARLNELDEFATKDLEPRLTELEKNEALWTANLNAPNEENDYPSRF